VTKYLEELGPDARRAVAAAESEAMAMGYDRVGTEHLLLGVLCGETTGAATMLSEAGATLPAARHKVREAMPPTRPGEFSPPLPRTPRGERALGRAVRLSHQHRAEAVTSEHLLWGVLDVEGTAGQVLRRLGVDVDRLRTALDMQEPASIVAPDEPVRSVGAPLSCPSCGADLIGSLVYRAAEATGEHGRRRVIAFSCSACACVLGVTSA
jgi:ATP-dependent Clp protease ATP-binding subunit ClpA